MNNWGDQRPMEILDPHNNLSEKLVRLKRIYD